MWEICCCCILGTKFEPASYRDQLEEESQGLVFARADREEDELPLLLPSKEEEVMRTVCFL